MEVTLFLVILLLNWMVASQNFLIIHFYILKVCLFLLNVHGCFLCMYVHACAWSQWRPERVWGALELESQVIVRPFNLGIRTQVLCKDIRCY